MPDQIVDDRSKELLDPQLQCELRGARIVTDDLPEHQPLVVPQTTCLSQLSSAIDDRFGVFVTDEDGRVIGLVHADEILTRLNSGHPRERERWAQAPISSLLMTRISAREPNDRVGIESSEATAAILEQGRIIGIATSDDVMLSWKFIQPALRKAAVDPLTGLINRANFERRLEEEWDRSRRRAQSVGVILCDIDRFKQVNDNFGHSFGDLVVQRIATTLEQSLRSYDVVSRFGGDEFVCLCLGCEPGEIAIPMARMQAQIEGLVHARGQETIRATMSFGAAVCHAGFESQDAYDLVEVADKCLYQGKSQGRNRGYFADFDRFHHSPEAIEMIPVPRRDPALRTEELACDDAAFRGVS